MTVCVERDPTATKTAESTAKTSRTDGEGCGKAATRSNSPAEDDQRWSVQPVLAEGCQMLRASSAER
eukprot:667679-Rhodomonas_salina.3